MNSGERSEGLTWTRGDRNGKKRIEITEAERARASPVEAEQEVGCGGAGRVGGVTRGEEPRNAGTWAPPPGILI